MKILQSDIDFLLAQLTSPTPVDPLSMTGIRAPSGDLNNLYAGREHFGAADQPFLTVSHQVDTRLAEGNPFAGNSPTAYNNTDAFIVDSTPREISNLVVNQTGDTPNTPRSGIADSLPFSGWMSLFGQFFDHGLDLIGKGQNGTVMVPLLPGDPLYQAGSQTNFMMLSRANFTVDGNGQRVYENLVSPWVDQNQTYGSHAGMTVFLREYDASGVATGRLVSHADGTLATWADLKANAARIGLTLTDADVVNLPQVQLNPDGTYAGVPGQAQFVLDGSGNKVRIGHAFLDDIAHGASPVSSSGQELAPGQYNAALLNAHYIAGDGRVNENFGLTAVHEVFHAEHNRALLEIQALVAERGPEFAAQWTGEMYFQAARVLTETQYQHMVFTEFTNRISPNITTFSAYDATINPAVSIEFSQAVYRFGHSMLTEQVDTVDSNGNLTQTGLIQAFLNPLAFANNGGTPIDGGGGKSLAAAVAVGMSRQVGSEIDEFVTDALRNNLVGLPLDLAAINIARGRDVGLPSLNAVRTDLFNQTGLESLRPYGSWQDFGDNLLHPASLKNFVMAYAGADLRAYSPVTYTAAEWAALRTTDWSTYAQKLSEAADAALADADFMGLGGNQKFQTIDLWLGGLAEQKVPQGMLGATFDFIFATQMQALQDGDRFYYNGRLEGTNLLAEERAQTFADIVMRNTGAKHLYGDIFSVADAYVEIGTPSTWAPRDGISPADPRIGSGWTLNAGQFAATGLSEMIGGTAAADNIVAGAGADTVYGDGGSDTIDGGVGNDRIYGGDGSDVIVGGAGVDQMFGEAGNDTISGGDLNDTMLGGDGNDTLNGGASNDQLRGGTGNDQLDGGTGTDTMVGNAGDDTYFIDDIGDRVEELQDEGVDEVRTTLLTYSLGVNVENLTYTGSGFFVGTGNALANRMTGGTGRTTLSGAAGDDILIGNNLNDTLDGGAGNDTLDGGGSNDIMRGGTGNDTYIVDHAADFTDENLDEGVADTVLTALSAYSLRQNVERLTFTGNGAFAGTGNTLGNVITGGAGNDVLDGGDGADTLIGLGGADTLIGGNGADGYSVDDVGDVVVETSDAGSGTDTVTTTLSSYALGANVENLVYAGSGSFSGVGTGTGNNLTGGGGADTLDGAAGTDFLFGLAGNDTLIGGEGTDTLDGGLGADAMSGGNGNDTYEVDNALDVVNENASQGTDLVRTTLNAYALGANVENLTFTGVGNFAGTGNTLANVIVGGAGDDTLVGGGGADNMTGGLGNDLYDVDAVGDVVTESAAQGVDTVRTTLGSYVLGANLENLSFIGSGAFNGSGNDTANVITGGSSGDTLAGNGGDDSLLGGGGGDVMTGGDGDDLYAVDNAGDQVIEAVGGGTDRVQATLASYTMSANVERLEFVGVGNFVGTGNAGANEIVGGNGNDTLDGAGGADSMTGGLGNDTYTVDEVGDVVTEQVGQGIDTTRTTLNAYALSANVESLVFIGSGAFTGTGNAEDNAITGGTGDDTLDGAAGSDTLTGGLGDDTYVVDTAGDVVVESAGQGIDTVRTTLNAYTLGNAVENLVFIGSGDFAGTGNASANEITGGIGNDVLDGAAGSDVMTGGQGSDTYSVDDVGDLVVEALGQGTDTVLTTLASYTLTANVENLTYVGGGNFVGTGNGLANVILGGAGDDLLTGGGGADTYGVDNVGDVVVELAGGGYDNVLTTLNTYVLGDNLEALRFVGSGDFFGTGNDENNTIEGGDGNDTLVGGIGNDNLFGKNGDDLLIGGQGDDVYGVNTVGDQVVELAGEGIDEVRTALNAYVLGSTLENLSFNGVGDFAGTGNAADNVITGGAGNDTLDGLTGADTMAGGEGNDSYSVDDTGDQVVEASDSGSDTVYTSLNAYALTPNVENLSFVGNGSFVGTGNAEANTITGGVGNDVIDGGTGADLLIGAAGDDAYRVDDAGDQVVEAADDGVDTVRTTLNSYTLTPFVDHLVFDGVGNFAGTGNELANDITGADGNDTLDGAAGDDTLTGGQGNDTYVIDSVGDLIIEAGGHGTDTVRTSLNSYTLAAALENLSFVGSGDFVGTGNAADNAITGGAGNDTLDGLGGDDVLTGGVGDDTYQVQNAGDVVVEAAAEGVDTVFTDLSSHTLAANVENLVFVGGTAFAGTGNAENNAITGGSGDDTLIGGAGDDTLTGGLGNDIYDVDSVGDVVVEIPGQGLDTVRTTLNAYALGEALENLVFIGSGNFAGTGNSASNQITGGAGDDTLDGAANDDTLVGGNGNDTYVIDSAGDVIVEIAGEGADTVQTSLNSFTLAATLENLSFVGSGSFTGTGNGSANVITGGAGNDVLSGAGGDDSLIGGAGVDTMTGGTGNDSYEVDSLADVLVEVSSQGTDTVRTSLQSYTLATHFENLTFIGAGNFTGTGNGGINVLTGGAGNDTLSGNAGGDTLIGGAGADVLLGGAGSDFYEVDNAGDVVTEASGEGTDTVNTTLAAYTLGANVERLVYTGAGIFVGTGNELGNVITGGAGDDSLNGAGGADTLNGGAGNDTLNGGAGADAMRGNDGDDTYEVDNAGDTVVENAGQGLDTVRVALNTYVLSANVENLIFVGAGSFNGTGNTAANVITGGAGNDTLDGGSGNDTLIGGGGADTLRGGTGGDTYVVDSLSDSVVEASGGGSDLVQTALSSYALGANVENLTFIGVGDFTGTGNSVGNVITGGAGNDTLVGGAGSDTMVGGAGNDTYDVANGGDVVVESAGNGLDTVRTTLASYTLGSALENLAYIGSGNFSGTGNDDANTITGGTGTDTLVGAGGDDSLNGAVGGDSLRGGQGHDTYDVDSLSDVVVENPGEGVDMVRTTLASYALGANVENLIFFGAGNFTGTGNEFGNVIIGGAGDDTLDGGAGNDAMTGGMGNDLYVVGQVGDAVIESAGEGTDSVRTTLNSYTLGSAVENLTFIGSGSFFGIGNAAANVITGGSGNDTLAGAGGADALIGGAGNDTYQVNNAGVSVVENAGEGADTIRTALNAFALQANFENLTFTGTGAFTGTGNSAANVMTGAAGNDVLSGGGDDDTFVGALGNDVFNGDLGVDTAVYAGLRSDYTVVRTGPRQYTITHSATGEFDVLNSLEFARFSNQTLSLVNHNGSVSISDLTPTEDQSLSVANTLGAVTITGYDWQSSVDGLSWSYIPGATQATFSPGDAQVGQWIRVVVTFSDGNGPGNQAVSAPTTAVENVNDVPAGTLTISDSTPLVGQALSVINTVTDGDGIPLPMNLQWEFQRDELVWTQIEGANSSTFTVPTELRGAFLRVVGTYTDGQGNAETVVSSTAVSDNNTFVICVPGGVLTGTEGNDTITGSGSPNQIYGLGGDDTLYGGFGYDSIFGGDGNDTLFGQIGLETLNGDNGDDILVGGPGDDILTGGAGKDVFLYEGSAQSPFGIDLRDTITDFTKGDDTIDLSALDANTTGGGNSAFTFMGETKTFTGVGQLIYYYNSQGTMTIIECEISGDGIADFQIGLLGTIAFTATDFIL